MSVDTQHLLLFVQVVLQFLHLREEWSWLIQQICKRQELRWACLETGNLAMGQSEIYKSTNLHEIARFLWYSNILDSLAGNIQYSISLLVNSPCPVAQLSSSSRHSWTQTNQAPKSARFRGLWAIFIGTMSIGASRATCFATTSAWESRLNHAKNESS